MKLKTYTFVAKNGSIRFTICATDEDEAFKRALQMPPIIMIGKPVEKISKKDFKIFCKTP